MNRAAWDSLTPKERDCLRASLGRTADEVAVTLGISPNTVKTHLAAARRKLGSMSKGAAARALVEWEAGHQFPVSQIEVMEPPVESEPPPAPNGASMATPSAWSLWLPFRTGAHNDLSPIARLIWIILLSIAAGIGFGSFASGVRLVSDLFR